MSSNKLNNSCEKKVESQPDLLEKNNADAPCATQLSTMTKLVRMVGAGLLVVSASTFMIQQWDLGNDLFRYMVLLGHTSILALAGFFCGLTIKESRGARTFLGLVLISIPVHFAVLGGLIYSQFSMDGAVENVQEHVMWTAASPAEALGLLGIGMAVLIPICMISMTAFARKHMKQLTISYMVMNLALLIPVRGADTVGVLAAGAVLVFCGLQRFLFWDKPLLRNAEGRFVRLMMLAPVCIIVGRSIYLYELSAVSTGLMMICASALVFVFVPRLMSRMPRFGVLLQGLSIIPAAIGWGLIAFDLVSGFDISYAMQIPLLTLPISLMLVLMSLGAKENACLYRRIAAPSAVVPLCINLLFFPGLSGGLFCLGMGIITMVYGVYIRQKIVALIGANGLVFGVVYYLYNIIRVETLGHWAVLSVAGICLIIGASLFERRSQSALRYLAVVRQNLSTWEY